MDEVCEIVLSQKGCEKISVRGYLMTKERNRENKFYWCCELRKSENCKGRATTKVCDGRHYLQKFVDHNHSPQASAISVAKTINRIKESAKQNNVAPCQILQTNMSTVNSEILPYLPPKSALRKKISYARKGIRPSEPQSLEDLEIPENLCKTLREELFLVRDSTVGDERILLFTTKSNIERLASASYWIMDGTFKTVPNIFYQLYTIHAPVGNENLRVLPMVFALMSSKRQEIYKRVFEDLIDYADENGIELRPRTILTDLELAAINATKCEFPAVNNKVCFFSFRAVCVEKNSDNWIGISVRFRRRI